MPTLARLFRCCRVSDSYAFLLQTDDLRSGEEASRISPNHRGDVQVYGLEHGDLEDSTGDRKRARNDVMSFRYDGTRFVQW